MPLIASNAGGSGPSIPLCEPGIFSGVCAHVCDLGHEFDQTFGKWKHIAVLLFEIDQIISQPGGAFDGKRYMLSLRVTVSLGEKAALRRYLNGWRGKSLTDAECAAFDLDRLKGKPCMVTVTANTAKNGKEYRNIAALAPLMKNFQALTPETTEAPGWVAKQKAANDMAWEAYQATQGTQGDHEPIVVVDDPLPPAHEARPAQRLVTEGRVPLSQPQKNRSAAPSVMGQLQRPPVPQRVDSPPAEAAYDDPGSPPF